MLKIPCKDCICFAVCKPILNSECKIVTLYIKCDLYKDWYEKIGLVYTAEKITMELFND